ncbi:MAG: hypothetical protein ACYC7A_07815 [Thermoanaerobaculia bacterium]
MSTRDASTPRSRARRFARKHAVALVGLAVFHFIFFFPTLFMGRVVSPNDIFYNYDPWRSIRGVEAQNPLLNDPATAYGTLISLLRAEPDAFHWNRFTGSGIPGFGSAAAAVLSPFVAIPAVALPPLAVYSGIILLKVNFAFVFAYLWLRVERVGKRGAAIGALAYAISGVFAVWWLWQGTNATALYPAVLYVIARMFSGARVRFTTSALIVAALLLSGFPATIVYIGWVAIAYAIFLSVVRRAMPLREIGRAFAATAVGTLAVAPFVIPFVQLLKRSGYLEARADVAGRYVFPLDHLRAFFDPFIHGNPAEHLWRGDAILGRGSNFVETTVFVGIAVIILSLLAIPARRARTRWFWLALAVLLVLAIFGNVAFIQRTIANLPGIGYSPLTRLRVLLPLVAAFLAASGASWIISRVRASRVRHWLAGGIAAVVAAELGLFAASFYPYLRPDVAKLPHSQTVAWLSAQRKPFRVAPTFDYLWPNTSELVRLEDIRSHFGSEKRYRDLLQRIDPGSWGGSGTVLQFNSLRMDAGDPLLSMLNARFVLEQPSIDILRWKTIERTDATGAGTSARIVAPGSPLQFTLVLDERNAWALDIPVRLRGPAQAEGTFAVRVVVPETGKPVWSRIWKREEVRHVDKIYVPLPRNAAAGNAFVIEAEADGLAIAIPRNPATPQAITYGIVRTPLIHVATFDDGRVFENLAVLERFHAVWETKAMSVDEMLTDRAIDYASTAVVDDNPVELAELRAVPRSLRRVRFTIEEYGSSSRITTRAAAPFFLVSSEKLTPELRIDIDGRPVNPVVVNGLFAGVRVGSGEHRVVFSRRIGRGWWPGAAAAWIVIGAAFVLPLRRRSAAGQRV